MTPLTADDRAAFEAAIAAAPRDALPRLVYADRLGELGDTAGEQAQRLGAVIADPDSDRLRLDFAGWLEAHGEPEWAELIRVQVELARFPAEPPGPCHPPLVNGRSDRHHANFCGWCRWREDYGDQVAALRGRERLLLTWHGAWREQYGIPYRAWMAMPDLQWRRGFISEITLDWPAACAHLDAVLAAAPVTEVTLTGWPMVERLLHDWLWRFIGRGKVHPLPRHNATGVEVGQGYSDYDTALFQEMLAAEWPRVRAESWHLPPAPHGVGGGIRDYVADLERAIIEHMAIPPDLIESAQLPP
jgi:uncharacterized protein (TIGR02996 family)